MASGGGQQQHQHKISPRKFSEKIALLNKKQLEGNAEFEEIIKEVQATRSQSACGNNNWPGNNGSRMGGDDGASSGLLFGGDVERAAILSGDDGLVVDETNLTSEQQDELEEVYQDLIKGVKQDNQQQQQQRQPNHPADTTNFNDNNFQHYNSTSITRLPSGANRTPNHSNHHQHPHQQPLPLNQSTCVNIPNDNDLNPYIQTFETTQDTTATAPTKRTNILEPYPLYAREPVAVSCRARGTSIGSTNYKHICANALQPRTYQQPSSSSSCNNNYNNNYLAQDNTSWLVSNGGGGNGSGSDGIYLKPSGAYDRTWQKSSSDPALHVPCNLLPNNSSIVNPNLSCFSDNFSTIDQTRDPEQCQQRQSQGNLIKMAEDNNNSTVAILSINDSEQQENMGPMVATTTIYNYIDTPQQSAAAATTNSQQIATTNSQQIATKIQDQGYFATISQNQQQSAVMIDGGGSGGSLSLFKQYVDNNNENNNNDNIDIRGNLPGIKICAVIDDDCTQRPDHQVSRASSLSDLAANGGGIQFDASNESQEFEQIDDQSNDSRQELGAGDVGRNNMAPNGWISSDGLDQDGCNRIDNFSQVRLAFDGDGNDGDGIVFDHNRAIESNTCSGWSNIVSNNTNPTTAADNNNNNNNNLTSAIYEPLRVNNLLSNSECGLSHHQLLLATDDLSNINMIRSHSHNSIDYLTRHKRAPTSINYSASTQYHQPQQYHHLQQHQHQPVSNQLQYPGQQSYNLVQFGPPPNNRLQSKYDGSVSSMRPQHGSISPLDSSSNLASPQSEQNSPGSSADYGEPSITFQEHNQQHQLNNINQIETPMSECLGGDFYLADRNYQPRDESGEQNTFTNCASSPAATTTLAYAPSQQEVQLPAGAGSYAQAVPFAQQQQHFQLHQIASQQSMEPTRSVGPCQSFSLSRRLHNQACRGSYSMQFSSSSTNLPASILPAAAAPPPLPKESHANIRIESNQNN